MHLNRVSIKLCAILGRLVLLHTRSMLGNILRTYAEHTCETNRANDKNLLNYHNRLKSHFT